MARRVDVVLEEILETLARIEAALGRQSFETFRQDWLLQRAIERALEIISEAVRHIPEETLALRPEIPWVDIKAIGNVIRHEYHRVDPAIIWSVVKDDLPALHTAITALLGAPGTR
ncbi:MAG: DUF86 domain-containing protein [Proteobacteria bacterium]|nr:DUF86 domain-containing protein [Pseudomonadota bacterium]